MTSSESLNNEDYMPDDDSNQPLLEMFRNCCDEEQFLQLIDQTISTKLSFGVKKVCELMVKKINVLLEQKHQELTTVLQCKYDENKVRIVVNDEVNMRLKEITDTIETKCLSRLNQLKVNKSGRSSLASSNKATKKLHRRKLSINSVKSAKMMTTEDSQRSPFTNKSSRKSILKSEKLATPKSGSSLNVDKDQIQVETSPTRVRVRVKTSLDSESKGQSEKGNQNHKFMSPEQREKSIEEKIIVSEGKAPKPTTETRGSSIKSKRSELEFKKPERMTFGPQSNAQSKQETPRGNDKDEHLPFQFKSKMNRNIQSTLVASHTKSHSQLISTPSQKPIPVKQNSDYLQTICRRREQRFVKGDYKPVLKERLNKSKDTSNSRSQKQPSLLAHVNKDADSNKKRQQRALLSQIKADLETEQSIDINHQRVMSSSESVQFMQTSRYDQKEDNTVVYGSIPRKTNQTGKQRILTIFEQQKQQRKKVMANQIANDIDCVLNQSSSVEESQEIRSRKSLRLNMKKFDNDEHPYGLTVYQTELFGDRMPGNHQKVKLLSLNHTQLYWLAEKKSADSIALYMEQQIPKQLLNAQDKFNLLGQEQRFFDKIVNNNFLRQFVFKYEGIIDKDDLDDVWAIYKVGADQINNTSVQFMSLKDALFKCQLKRTGPAQGHYAIDHGEFYRTVNQSPSGLSHLAWLIRMLCQFLKTLHEQDINYGNLRAENILIKFAPNGKRIESLKLINFGHIQSVGQMDLLTVPEQVDHLPADHLLDIADMLRKQQKPTEGQKPEVNPEPKMKLEQSFDVYSLGILILEIIVGCPMQMQLPIKCQCSTVDGQVFQDRPLFGQAAPWGRVDVKHIVELIEYQQSLFGDLAGYLKDHDHYNLCGDADLLKLIQRMLHSSKQPSASEILQHKFIRKWN